MAGGPLAAFTDPSVPDNLRQETCHALSASLPPEVVLLNKIPELSKAEAKELRGADLDATGLSKRTLHVRTLNFLQVLLEIEA
jgi:hypothetical protein